MDREELQEIVEFWRKQLGLFTWDITYDWPEGEASSDSDDAPYASVWRSRDYQTAKLWFNWNFPTWTRFEAHWHVCHELLHLVTREMEFILTSIEDMLHRDVYQVVKESHHHQVEGVIDFMAHRLLEMHNIRREA